MWRKRILTSSLAVMVGMLGVGMAQKTTISFAFWGGQEELDLTKKLADQFTAANPNIEIKLQQIDSNTYEQKLLIQIAGGTAPDTMVIRDASSSFLARRGIFADLNPLITKTGYNLGAFGQAAVRAYRLGNAQYGLPREITPVVMYYNKALFDAAGVAYPKPTWTYDDFVAASKKLTRDTNSDGKMDTWGTWMVPWDALYLPIVYSYGGNLLSSDGTKSALLTANTVQAFQFASDLINVHKVAPPIPEAEAMGWIDAFAQGKFAMIPQGRWATPIFLDAMEKAKATFQFDVVATPRGRLQRSVNYSSAVGILAASKNQEAAFRWITFLTGEQGQSIYGGPRSLVVAANQKVAATVAGPGALPANARLFLSDIQKNIAPPQTPSFSAFYEILNRNLKEVFLGLKPVKDGLTVADREINDMLKKAYDSLK